MAIFNLIRVSPTLVQLPQLEANDYADALAQARELAAEDARASEWRVDHDAFDRARDDGPDTTEADAQAERDQDWRWEPRLAE